MGLDADPAAGQGRPAQLRPSGSMPAALPEGPAAAGSEPAARLPQGLLTHSLERPQPARAMEGMRRTWVSGLFVDSLAGEQRPGARRPDRPRVAAIAVSTIVFLVITTVLAVWPHVSHQLSHAGAAPRVAVKPVTTHAAGPGQATPQTGQVDTGPATGGAPVTVPVQDIPASSGSGQAQPIVAQPASGTTTVTAPPPVTRANQAASQPAPQPTPTFVNTEVISLGSPTFAKTGTWNTYPRGGAPDFNSPIFWTGDQTATATWSLGNPSGGQQWDKTRVRVWIPDPLGGALVRYTVHYPTFDAPNPPYFDVPQEKNGNWYQLGNTFNIGTTTQRTGSIWVVMTYRQPYPNPSDPACPNGSCWSMGASSVEFAWS